MINPGYFSKHFTKYFTDNLKCTQRDRQAADARQVSLTAQARLCSMVIPGHNISSGHSPTNGACTIMQTHLSTTGCGTELIKPTGHGPCKQLSAIRTAHNHRPSDRRKLWLSAGALFMCLKHTARCTDWAAHRTIPLHQPGLPPQVWL